MKAKGFTRVYIADVSPLLDLDIHGSLRKAVPEERRGKADKMKSAKGKAQSLGAGLALHEACKELAAEGCKGIQLADQHIIYGQHEKPDFDQQWLRENGFDEIHFSLSHSGYRVMCVISTAPVGCDVELVKDRNMNIARRFFTEEEYADIMEQPDDSAKADRFFRYWTLKESFIKCDGRGLGMPLDSFRIIIDPEGGAEIKIDRKNRGEIKEENSRVAEYTFAQFDPDVDYRYSCCVKGLGCQIQQRILSLVGN